MKKYGFGVDVGGTTIKMGFFETDGKLLDKWEIKTDTTNGGENILSDIAKSNDYQECIRCREIVNKGMEEYLRDDVEALQAWRTWYESS